ERYGLGEELCENITALGAHSHADSNLTCALRHAHEHDVHNANAAHDQRDEGDRKEQHSHYLLGRGHGIHDFLLVANVKIVLATLSDPVALPEQVDDLLLGAQEHAGVLGLHIDAAQGGCPGHALHGARVGNDQHIILVASLNGQ